MQYAVGIAEMKITRNPADVLVAYSLGSCIGVSLYDPVKRIGGLAHCMLPLSTIDARKARDNPLMFTDTGVTLLIQKVLALGARVPNLQVKAAGAALLLDEKRLFKIGERNYSVMRKVLSQNNITITAEDVGGTAPRTLVLHLDTGLTLIRSAGREVPL